MALSLEVFVFSGCITVGPALTAVGIWCLRRRRAEHERRETHGTLLLWGRTPGEIVLAINGWPNLVGGLGITALGIALVPGIAIHLAAWRYGQHIVVSCSHEEVVVRNDTGGDLYLRVNDIGLLTHIDRDGVRSVQGLDWLKAEAPYLVLREGQSLWLPLRWPGEVHCRLDDCRTLTVRIDASGEGPIPPTWHLGPRDVSLSRDCRLPTEEAASR